MRTGARGRRMACDIVGIDIGSAAVGLVLLGGEGGIETAGYALHHGQVAETLERLLRGLGAGRNVRIACTASTPGFVRAGARYDDKVAAFRCAQRLHPGLEALLYVGAQTFWLLMADSAGTIRACRTNTACAAGTGSFLDQQASRLGLEGSWHLSQLARGEHDRFPLIASRCAVFAKTDLIHAQQSGYSIGEIAYGLCRGLAHTIVDTLFSEPRPQGKVVFCGGVSLNESVREHLERILGHELAHDAHAHLYGAMGAALMLLDEFGGGAAVEAVSTQDVIVPVHDEREYHHAPLDLVHSSYPDFKGIVHEEYEYRGDSFGSPVEVDVYQEIPKGKMGVYGGIDVGSTSTKAVITDMRRNVVAGFYTRTSGAPVEAVRAILAAIEDMTGRFGVELEFLGVATTGSGRKLIGSIVGADLVVDEITAHAKAAIEIDPEVDTIIEIGGQDAKFTILENGSVTFCAMNTVCAAGTGSFIEEQAARLACPLSECSSRALEKKAPLASDRCTVFMERDLAHLLGRGYSHDEVLASALHAVCENYLNKVATKAAVGRRVCFQGATAKNKALVAAFEQRLGRPILVSRFPHLTGAYGASLLLAEENVRRSSFRGLGLHRGRIDVRTETCSLCTNHCKITVADVEGETAASGFLCGRDYGVVTYVDRNTSGFDLLRQRRKILSAGRPHTGRTAPTVGLPDALHMKEDHGFWKHFFDRLGIATYTPDMSRGALDRGRRISGAEFCMPVQLLFSQLEEMAGKVDCIFLPVYLEDAPEARADGARRQYCYVTQFAPSVAAARMEDLGFTTRMLTPLVGSLSGHIRAKIEIHRALGGLTGHRPSLFDVSRAYDDALAFKARAEKALRGLYHENVPQDSISVVLLGRPYTVLSPALNKGIVSMFEALGVRTFFQDMVPTGRAMSAQLESLLKEVPWKYGAAVLKAADTAAQTPGLYPVFVTSFRCTPDAFVLECFRMLMHSCRKPYLVLQLDGHDTTAGYETRIEAAVRSFRNHYRTSVKAEEPSLPDIIPESRLTRATVFVPDWDSLSCRLLAANLRREGVDARLLEQSEKSLREGLSYNTCQCIPITILAQEYIDAIKKNDLDPADCALWIPKGEIACNLKVIPHHIKNVLNTHGKGMERAQVFNGDLAMRDFSLRAATGVYFSFMFGGMMRRAACSIRPYELVPGAADRALAEGMDLLERAFEGSGSKTEALRLAVDMFKAIPVMRRRRPKVAIFGDLYVRDNDFMNQDLVRFLEGRGAEVVTMPYTTYAKMVLQPYLKRWLTEGKYLFALSSGTLIAVFRAMERRYLGIFEEIVPGGEPSFSDNPEHVLGRFRITTAHTGESMDNILKVHYLLKHHPDLRLFVLVSPAFCCPGLVTEAMIERIERVTGVGVVSIVYDGTGGMKNMAVVPPLSRLTGSATQDSRETAAMLGLAG